MEVKSSGIFDKIVIKSEISFKKASKVCVAEGFARSGGSSNIILLKMYRKDMVVNHDHIWNERNVLEHIRDCQTMTEDEKLALPLIHDSLVLEEKDTGIKYICIALNYIQGQTLDKYLNDSSLTIDFLKRVFIQVAKIIGSLHREGIMHRDIKCSNIIIESETERVILIDMSLACFVDVEKQRLTEFCGIEFDWWSFGVLIYEMVFGIPPYGYHPEENKYLLKKINESPKSLSFPEPVVFMGDIISNKKNQEDTENLIMQLLNSDESTRLGSKGDFKQVIEHPWFNSCHFPKVE
ncbi:kinase domain-containing [Cryptosporidium sp. chipmunk genotype I]|uniref:kinase domain-containing n=1 Tax=Cryptosporidium sp. chipmunk genotype I TaxID=1280935 RepID=UPI003519D963|nr:kinase domain-containing [Cryptosporidium sp. chipmunk genotype I]